MAEEVKKIKSKNAGFEYKLLNHADKLGLLLEAMLDYETVLFNHNINMLDENHSEYPAWKATKDEIEAEIMRLRFLYEKLGGSWDNFQDMGIQRYDEYGEPV